LNYAVEIDFCEVYELVISFRAFLDKKSHKGLELGPSWVKSVRNKLSPKFIEELDNEKAKSMGLSIDLLLQEYPNQRTSKEFLEWLGELSAGEIYERIVPLVPEGWQPTNDLGEWRNRMIHLYSQWNEQYFQHMDSAILIGLKKDALEKSLLIDDLPAVEVVERVTNGLRIEQFKELKKILLVPQYHYRPSIRYHHLKDTHIYFYPVDARPIDSEEPSPSLMRLTRSLSDEKRLRILRFLAKGEKSFTEIVKFIGLAKSTVHHHMVILRSSGFVRVHVSGETGDRYSLRKGGLDQLNAQLSLYLKE
jgi:DNA-binding transcriptional ArsR family regulator